MASRGAACPLRLQLLPHQCGAANLREVPIGDIGRLLDHSIGAADPRDFAERTFTEYLVGIAGSLRFEPCELHYLGPLFCFVGNKLSEIGGRA
jgi:hypothetical protein